MTKCGYACVRRTEGCRTGGWGRRRRILGSLGARGCGYFFAEKDYLREVGQWYCDELKKSEWGGSVEVVEHKDVSHVFHLLSEPDGERALDLIKKIGRFIKQK
ncbi:hypothetical protein ACLB2K_020680 [Fragaria x ananassa]